MRAAIYIRVSTDEQKDGNSLEVQEEQCRAYIKSKGWQVNDVYNDGGYSGATLERPDLQQLLVDARAGAFDVVCVWAIDRFSRKIRHLINLMADLEERQICFVSISQGLDSTTPLGKMMIQLLGIVAELERENMLSRVKPNMAKTVESGRWAGGPPPIGYRLHEGKLLIIPAQAQIVRRIYQMCLEGSGVKGIALALNEEGCKKGNGVPWSGTHIHKILTSAIYLGHLVWNRRQKNSKRPNAHTDWIVVKNQHEAIIDAATFAAVQGVLHERQVNHVTRNLASPYLLTGILRCGKCGRTMIGTRRIINHRTKERRRSYCCATAAGGRGKCTNNSVDAERVEAAALSFVGPIARQDAILEAIKQHVEQLFAPSIDPALADELARLRAAAVDTGHGMELLLETFLAVGRRDEVVQQKYNQLKAHKEDLERSIQRTEARLHNAGAREAKVAEAIALLQNMGEVWANLTDQERKQALAAIFAGLEVQDGYLVAVTPTEEFAPFMGRLEEPVWCLLRQRTVVALNEELRRLRGSKTIRAFAQEVGISETYLGEIERGLAPLSDTVRGKIQVWQLQQSSP